jgi:hypothetical protein
MAAKKKNGNGRARAVAAQAVNGGGPPEGFTKIETNLIGFWKPEQPGQFVRGYVGEAVEKIGVDGKPNVFYSLTLTVDDAGPFETREKKAVEATAGQMIGVGGKMLLIFLRGREGKEVYVSYTGLGPAKRGQNPPKMFDTYEADGE